MPLIYNGQEAGYNHRLKFFGKDPIVWKPSAEGDLYQKLFALKSSQLGVVECPLGRAHDPGGEQRAQPGAQLRSAE